MLERILIEDFQSLRDVDLELAPFTVIVGRSNSGKSAVRRALQGLVVNAPATGRVRKGSSSLSVTVKTELGGEATWAKGSKVNAYVVDGVSITKPGAKAPEAVGKLLALSEINFAGQFDAPFLLMETSSAVANRLGQLTNVNLLFDGIREAERQRKRAGGEAKTLEGEQAFHQAVYDEAMEVLPTWQAKLTEQGALLTAAVEADKAAQVVLDAKADATLTEAVRRTAEATLAIPVPELPSVDEIGRASQLLRMRDEAIRYEAQTRAIYNAPEVPELPAIDEIELAALWTNATKLAQEQDIARVWANRTLGDAQKGLEALEAELATIPTCPTCGAVRQ